MIVGILNFFNHSYIKDKSRYKFFYNFLYIKKILNFFYKNFYIYLFLIYQKYDKRKRKSRKEERRVEFLGSQGDFCFAKISYLFCFCI